MSKNKSTSQAVTGQLSPDRVKAILDLLDEHYPDADTALDFGTPLEMLVSTILSAQCTDERVNQVTPALFSKYRVARDYADAPVEELEELIRSTGFFHNKAKNIQACCRVLDEQYGGEVPRTLDELVALPGVGRKTANCVLGNSFGIPGITVDTHVSRVSQRLGFTVNTDPVKIEFDLMAIIPEARWTRFSHQIILHGRRLCQARKPKTEICPLSPHCAHAERERAAGKA